MKKFIQKYWFLASLACLATILFFVRNSSQTLAPLVTGVYPLAGKLTSSPEKIEVGFEEQTINFKDNLSLSITPQTETSLSWQENKQSLISNESKLVVVFRQPLSQGEEYLFELKYNGEPLYAWSYQIAELLPTPTPISEKGDPEVQKEITDRTTQKYPLIKFMPHESENFYINYFGPLELGVKIKKGDKTEVKWEVYDWLQEKGVDVDSHKIIWLEE